MPAKQHPKRHRKQRLDKLLVARGLTDSRAKAQALIMAGKVYVDNHLRAKAGEFFSPIAELQVRSPPHPFVSRGGQKLAKALEHFMLNPEGVTALDIGASTGGFTHCLLFNGAAKVWAVDVGRGQLAWELRQNPQVVVMESTNIRNVTTLPPMDWMVVDVSFISLRIVLQHAAMFLKPSGTVIALVKPQFEAGREHVQKGGRVNSQAVHEQVLSEILAFGEKLGWQVVGSIPSPLLGKKSGNKEFLAVWHKQEKTSAGASA